ncbi:MAG: hypothetical protein KGH55_03600, partial [Nanoarchaeota archaeon]|nr:hypothetical protein [Nanoarchaeota archaeon]
RDSLPQEQRNEAGIRNWLVEHNIILINGNEEKSVEEILNDSFYPQLERILRRRLFDDLRSLSPRLENPVAELPVQIFPAVE